jgi:hypothetical protein
MAESLFISQFRILDNPETILHWKYDDIDEYAVFNLHIIEQKHYEYEILIQIQTLILNRQRRFNFLYSRRWVLYSLVNKRPADLDRSQFEISILLQLWLSFPYWLIGNLNSLF